jgi:hypothetical protein
MGGCLFWFLTPLGYFVEHPLLALLPAAVFLVYYFVRRLAAEEPEDRRQVRWSLFAGLVWFLYTFYELAMDEWSQGVSAPIRIDLVLVGPFLFLLTAVALWMAVLFETGLHGVRPPPIPNPYSRKRDRAFAIKIAILLVSFPVLELLVLLSLGDRDLRNKIVGLLLVLAFSVFLVLGHQWAKWLLVLWLVYTALFSAIGWSSLGSTSRPELAIFRWWDLAVTVLAVGLIVVLLVSKSLRDHLLASAQSRSGSRLSLTDRFPKQSSDTFIRQDSPRAPGEDGRRSPG